MSCLRHWIILIIVSVQLLGGSCVYAQRGKNGIGNITGANTVVNAYTTLSADAAAGASTISVASNVLNTNFTSPLSAGDLIMIIQMQGATLLGGPWVGNANWGQPRDSTWGGITSYNNCGNWEMGEVLSLTGSTDITLSCPLKNDYTAAGRVQVVRVPRYFSLTVAAGGSITCSAWNGTIGGVCAIEVENNTSINGSIDASGRGFRGGGLHAANAYGWGDYASIIANDAADKGEGIGGFQADYTPYGGRYGKGAPANAGGGGNGHNCGGGGGANGGNINGWNAHGNPDAVPAGWATAWNLQYAGFATNTSSGGGQGGYSFSSSGAQDPTVTAPGNVAWGGDNRRPHGGYGGRPLDYSTGRLFLGGGGGAGDQDDGAGSAGANGGGLIYLMSYGIVTTTGGGQLISNGSDAATSGRDGAGGGGGGGTVILNSVGAITGVSMNANGGKGGDQSLSAIYQPQAEGPGGGGGGGFIAVSNGAPTRVTNGGANGVTNSNGVLPQFPPNGATLGGVGTNTAIVTNHFINSANTTICTGQSATLNASLGGFPPGGTTITWYDALVGGNVLASGGTLTTTVITTAGTYTYYVGSCPGTYHQPVTVTVNAFPVVSVSPDVTICSGGSTTLTAGGASSYTWSPTAGLSNPGIANPVANPSATTTYVVSAATPCGPGTATVVVTVQSSLTPGITGNTSICAGGSTTLTASGGTTYTWSTGATGTYVTVSPTSTTTYTVNAVSGSCSGSATATVNVTSSITAAISPANTTLCPGSPTTLTASGGSSYSWSTGETTATIAVAPTATTTYSVTVVSASCSSTASAILTISNNLTSSITGPTNICAGSNATLTATGSGNYSWSTAETTAAITVNPTGTTTYSVIVAAGTCTASASYTLNVSPTITASISGSDTICGGTSTTLTASGGSTYVWNTGPSATSIAVSPAASTNTTYTVTATAGSCSDTATFTVHTLPMLVASVTGNNAICNGGTSTLTASVSDPANNSYLWNTGETTTTIQVSPSVSTTYTVTGFSGTCSDAATFSVTVIPQASLTVSPSTTICSGQSAQLSATGGVIYTWSNGTSASAITVSPFTNATYTVVGGLAACSDTDSVSVFVLPSPTVTITSSNTTICGGDVVTLNAQGGASYVWSNTATSSTTVVNPASTTTYTVIATSGSCNDTAVITVTVTPPPPATISGNNNICQGQSVTLTASPSGATYVWSSGETTQSINPTVAGNYSVLVSTGPCKDSAYITTVIAPNPVAVAYSDTTIIAGLNAYLSASGGTTYVWDNSMTGANITVSPVATTEYCVTVYDNNNCMDTACVTVTVDVCSKILYLPNAFSPNGDLENDELQIYYNAPVCIEKFKLVIYNRWGEKVYQTTDPLFKWDGGYKGWIFGTQTGGTQVYMYYLKAEIMGGTKIERKGNISLVQ